MPCRIVTIPGYGRAIACSRERWPRARRCVVCNVPETMATIKLCDGFIDTKKGSGTCDAPVCVAHAYHIEPDFDYCPRHAGQARQSSTS